jgi:tetratricopeptide (TPR) repeat protein
MMTDSVDPHGTPLHCDVLTAYRRDLERTPDVVAFGEHDARWLKTGLAVERLAAKAGQRPRRGSAIAKSPLLKGTRLLPMTERMEAAGALTTAFAILAAARQVWDTTDAESAGRAIFRQARICRTSGATAAAENYYVYLFGFATRHRLAELRGRALVGRGIIRTLQGDIVAGRAWYAKARTASGYHPVATAVSYHGEMSAALSQHDYSGALVCGSRALATNALGSYDEAGVLVNMASLALRAGRPKAALATIKRALRRSAHPRVRVSALAKGALAAAALGRRPLVDKFSVLFTRAAARVNIPYEELEARSELAQAYAIVGEQAKARRMARSIGAEAAVHQFATIRRRCDAILAAEPVEQADVVLNAPARRIVAELELV